MFYTSFNMPLERERGEFDIYFKFLPIPYQQKKYVIQLAWYLSPYTSLKGVVSCEGICCYQRTIAERCG
jgi:hypothetical protein